MPYEATVRTGKGAKLEFDVSETATPDWVTMELATNLRMTRSENEEIDQTHLLSDAREVGSGLPGVKTIEVSGWFDPLLEVHKDVFELAENGAELPMRLTWPGGATWTFDGVVMNFSPSSNSYNENMSYDATVKIDGEVTWTIPS